MSDNSELNNFISTKMHKMKDEDRPQTQKVAIAYSYARKEGLLRSKKPDSGLKIPQKLVDKEKKAANKDNNA